MTEDLQRWKDYQHSLCETVVNDVKRITGLFADMTKTSFSREPLTTLLTWTKWELDKCRGTEVPTTYAWECVKQIKYKIPRTGSWEEKNVKYHYMWTYNGTEVYKNTYVSSTTGYWIIDRNLQ